MAEIIEPNFINEDGAKEIAQNIYESQQAPIEEENESIRQLTALLATTSDQDPDQLMAILQLPEDHFSAIAPHFLSELERLYNLPENKMQMARVFNVNGYTLEDLTENFDELNEAIETLRNNLSDHKIDFLKEVLSVIYTAVASCEGIAKRIVMMPICRGEGIKLPEYQTNGAAAMDVCSTEEYTIKPGERVLVKTGIKLAIPQGYAILVQPRSGMSLKTKLRIANTPGLIDSDYRGEIGVIMENVDPPIKEIYLDEEGRIKSIEYGSSYTIGKGERIAQLRLVEVPKAAFFEVDNLDNYETERGDGGFGSTGKA